MLLVAMLMVPVWRRSWLRHDFWKYGVIKIQESEDKEIEAFLFPFSFLDSSYLYALMVADSFNNE